MIAVFTKYDQFKREIKMKMEDACRDSGSTFGDEVERIFHQHYLAGLGGTPPFVCLESENLLSTNLYCTDFCLAEMHKHEQRCTDLIEVTANALSGNVVAIMLLALQKDNLELNINQAIRW